MKTYMTKVQRLWRKPVHCKLMTVETGSNSLSWRDSLILWETISSSQKNGLRFANVDEYKGDNKHVVQSFSDKSQCWHAGNATYNRNSIGIEICVNSDGNYKKAVDNAAELVKSLMKKYNIPIGNVIQHNKASDKDCPHFIRAGSKGVNWSQFISKIGGKKGTTTTSSSGGSSGGSSYTSVASTWTGQNLKKWHKGGAVKQLQKLVGVKADGYFGADTVNAVKKAQKKHGLAVDGIAGKDTYKALTKKTSKNKSSSSKSIVKGIQKWIGTKADGANGPKTQKALTKKLQSELNKQFNAGLAVDGIWGAKTYNAVVNVNPGARGNLTKVLQAALYLNGYTVVGKPD